MALSPDSERKAKLEAPAKPKETDTVQKENIQPESTGETNSEPTVRKPIRSNKIIFSFDDLLPQKSVS